MNQDTTPTVAELAKMIDHSLLHPTMTDDTIRSGCEIARIYQVATACIKPYSIELALEILEGSDVGVCPVIGFPHGNSSTTIKAKEAEDAVRRGGTEIDAVINIGKVLGGNWNYVSNEIRTLNETVREGGAILKLIFENDYLEDEHILRLCDLCSEHQVAFVKTSSGYGFVKQKNGDYNYKGATDHHLKLMRDRCPSHIEVKAAGGVRTLDDLLHVRSLGISRIGATATEAILDEARNRGFSET